MLGSSYFPLPIYPNSAAPGSVCLELAVYVVEKG